MDNKLLEQLVGEIAGLKATLQATLGALAVYAGKGSNVMEGVHKVAHDIIQKDEVTAPGCDPAAIKARAETVIDKIIGNTTINHA